MIDLQTLHDTLAIAPLPTPNTAAHFRYMVLKGEVLALLYAQKYDHRRAKQLLAAMIGGYGRPVWRWVGQHDWHDGLPPGVRPDMEPYQAVRLAVLPHCVEPAVLSPRDTLGGSPQQWAPTEMAELQPLPPRAGVTVRG